MTAGRLAAKKPGATTNAVLYRCPTTVTGSTVVNVCNQSGSGATYRMALRDYDQVLHLNGPESENGGLASSYDFTKGNPISAYRVKLNPGFQYSDAIPGTNFTTTNGAKGTILDIYKDSSDLTYYTKVIDISSTALTADSLAGVFTAGETVTGGGSGYTATFRGMEGNTGAFLEFGSYATGVTTMAFSRTTGLADGMYVTLGTTDEVGAEVVSIDASGIDDALAQVTVSRSALGTTARVVPAGLAANAWSASATVTTINEGAVYIGGDVTLTVTDSTGFVSGGVVLIDNELASIEQVNGNDLTLTRGVYGTADVDHNDGVNVTLLVDNGVYLVNYFQEGETITGTNSNASAGMGFDAATSALIQSKFVTTTTNAGADHVYNANFTLDIDRTFIFDLSDATCSNYPLKFSADSPEGTNGSPPGTEYTQGVSKVGTAGTAGAYTSILIDDNTAINMFAYADGLDGSSNPGTTQNVGFGINVSTDPVYTDIYIYDVTGEALVAADSFTINNVTQTVEPSGVYPGPYGYVMDWDPAKAHLKVALGEGSAVFADNTEFYDTPTLNNGTRIMSKAVTGKILSLTAIGAADAGRVAGTYTNLTADATGASGDIATAKFTVVVDGSGAATVTIVDGGEDFAAAETVQINDGQLGNGGGAALTFDVNTISTAETTSQTGLYSAEDYMYYDAAVAANTTAKVTGVVVGPGQNVLVYSSAADLSYVVDGFESPSEDYTVVQMTKITTDDGGGGVAP
jgi:hypothetical protein